MVGCARALIGLRVLLCWAEGEAQGTFWRRGPHPDRYSASCQACLFPKGPTLSRRA